MKLKTIRYINVTTLQYNIAIVVLLLQLKFYYFEILITEGIAADVS